MADTEPSLDQDLAEVAGVLLRTDEPLARHTPLRTGGPVRWWVEVADADALRQTLRVARRHKVRWTVHWPHQDLIVRDGGLDGLVVRPGAGFEGLRVEGADKVVLGAATPFGALAGLGPGWWSALARWPGTPGGLFHNGQQDSISGMISGLRQVRGRGVEAVEIEEGDPAPDLPGTAVLHELRLCPGLLSGGPLGRFGPPPPGHLLDDPPTGRGPARTAGDALGEAGLLGTRLRRWRFSTEDPGRVVNLGGGTTRDLLHLLQGARAQVERGFGLRLDLRLPVLGHEPNRRTARGRR